MRNICYEIDKNIENWKSDLFLSGSDFVRISSQAWHRHSGLFREDFKAVVGLQRQETLDLPDVLS
jgi:hypothetical protein